MRYAAGCTATPCIQACNRVPIVPPRHAPITIDGANASRFLLINAGVTADLNGLVVQNMNEGLDVGAAIKNSAFHAELEKAEAAGDPVWEMPTVDPGHLAGLLWTMHGTKGQREVIYP